MNFYDYFDFDRSTNILCFTFESNIGVVPKFKSEYVFLISLHRDIFPNYVIFFIRNEAIAVGTSGVVQWESPMAAY